MTKRHETMTQVGVCPVATMASLIDGKWKLLILRDLLQGTCRFSQLKRSVGGISQKMLTSSLREMESDGIVRRKAHATVPPRVDYSLTDLGESMRPVIEAMKTWGNAYIARQKSEKSAKKRVSQNTAQPAQP